jgi:hypothetical protein
MLAGPLARLIWRSAFCRAHKGRLFRPATLTLPGFSTINRPTSLAFAAGNENALPEAFGHLN